MAFSARDGVPLSQARATIYDLAEQVKAGAEKIITKNGESYVAIIDDASKGLDDVIAGKANDAQDTLNAMKRRTAKAQG